MNMKEIQVNVVRSRGVVYLPEYQTEGAAGFDLSSAEDIVVKAGQTAIIPTGLSFEIPTGYELQVRSRSGLAAKYSLFVLNAPGTIDSDYRGEVKVILHNGGSEDFQIYRKDRIAQGVIAPVFRAVFRDVESLSDTRRGSGGFGSTGV